MGLIKATADAISGVLADSWREYFYCDALDDETLVAKGLVRLNKSRGSNTKASDNLISNGSIIAVNEGQCMLIVDQGEVVEVCAQPGEYRYDASTEPSIFYGDLSQSVQDTLKQVGRRFSFGGVTGKDQRVYFFNIKEIVSNRFGTATPIPFRVVDSNIGLDMDISLRCNGAYSFQIVDPLLFYQNVCGNVKSTFTRSMIA
ncbi:MAG: SPFH domain-containing protein, partial [Lachnospiraceae bacterium]|nr:SPFH domain-containing protein [Lachnospiraceae bacterium]